MISGGYRCPLYDDDAAATTTDLGSDQATHQLDSAPARKANSGPLPILKPELLGAVVEAGQGHGVLSTQQG